MHIDNESFGLWPFILNNSDKKLSLLYFECILGDFNDFQLSKLRCTREKSAQGFLNLFIRLFILLFEQMFLLIDVFLVMLEKE